REFLRSEHPKSLRAALAVCVAAQLAGPDSRGNLLRGQSWRAAATQPESRFVTESVSQHIADSRSDHDQLSGRASTESLLPFAARVQPVRHNGRAVPVVDAVSAVYGCHFGHQPGLLLVSLHASTS